METTFGHDTVKAENGEVELPKNHVTSGIQNLEVQRKLENQASACDPATQLRMAHVIPCQHEIKT